jgi:hypothetical protein
MRSAGHGQQEALHLRGERAARGFLLHEAKDPIKEGADKCNHYEQLKAGVLLATALVSLEEGDSQINQRVKAEPCGHL